MLHMQNRGMSPKEDLADTLSFCFNDTDTDYLRDDVTVTKRALQSILEYYGYESVCSVLDNFSVPLAESSMWVSHRNNLNR